MLRVFTTGNLFLPYPVFVSTLSHNLEHTVSRIETMIVAAPVYVTSFIATEVEAWRVYIT